MVQPKEIKNIKNISYLNIVIILITSLIMLIPLFVFISKKYTHVYSGDSKAINLPIVISLIIFCCVISIVLFLFWIKQLKELTNSTLNLTTFKWILITIGSNFLIIILFSVAFFCIWLVEINNTTRLLCYSIVYSVLTVLSIIVCFGLVTYTNWKIEYFLTKNCN